MENHKYYKQAYDAHRGISYSPERRAISELQCYDQTCEELRTLGKESAIEKYTQLKLKHWGAKKTFGETLT